MGGRLGGLLDPDCVDDFGRGEDVFGLGVSVGLPGKHVEGVLSEPVVVESFSGVGYRTGSNAVRKAVESGCWSPGTSISSDC